MKITRTSGADFKLKHVYLDNPPRWFVIALPHPAYEDEDFGPCDPEEGWVTEITGEEFDQADKHIKELLIHE